MASFTVFEVRVYEMYKWIFKAFCALTAPILGVLRQKDKNKNTIRAAEIKLFFSYYPP